MTMKEINLVRDQVKANPDFFLNPNLKFSTRQVDPKNDRYYDQPEFAKAEYLRQGLSYPLTLEKIFLTLVKRRKYPKIKFLCYSFSNVNLMGKLIELGKETEIILGQKAIERLGFTKTTDDLVKFSAYSKLSQFYVFPDGEHKYLHKKQAIFCNAENEPQLIWEGSVNFSEKMTSTLDSANLFHIAREPEIVRAKFELFNMFKSASKKHIFEYQN